MTDAPRTPRASTRGRTAARRCAAAIGLWGAPLLLLLSGCQGCGATLGGADASRSGQGASQRSAQQAIGTTETGETGETRGATGTGPPDTSGPAGEPLPGGPAPALTLRGEPGHDGVELVLQNHHDAPVRLRTEIRVERATGAGFEPLVDTRLSLRTSCAAQPPACVELVPGAELRPPAWRSAKADAQCGCPEGSECGALPPGRYRFVTTDCAGGFHVRGAAFTLGSDDTVPSN